MIALRDAIPQADRERMSRAAAGRLLDLPAVSSAGSLLLFATFGSEIETGDLITRLLGEGRRVFLPRLESDEMSAVEFHEGDQLNPGAFGIGEPSGPGVDAEQVDAVIAPGLAFDREGYRLGYGSGYFDRFLRRTRPDAVRVGLGFHAQLIRRVPHGRGDEHVHVVVTDKETAQCLRRARRDRRFGLTRPRPPS